MEKTSLECSEKKDCGRPKRGEEGGGCGRDVVRPGPRTWQKEVHQKPFLDASLHALAHLVDRKTTATRGPSKTP